MRDNIWFDDDAADSDMASDTNILFASSSIPRLEAVSGVCGISLGVVLFLISEDDAGSGSDWSRKGHLKLLHVLRGGVVDVEISQRENEKLVLDTTGTPAR